MGEPLSRPRNISVLVIGAPRKDPQFPEFPNSWFLSFLTWAQAQLNGWRQKLASTQLCRLPPRQASFRVFVLTGSHPGTDFGVQETPTGVQDRLLLYCTSENAGQRGISGPCLKMLRFFVQHSSASTRCLFLTKRCVICSSHVLALRGLHVLLCVAKC